MAFLCILACALLSFLSVSQNHIPEQQEPLSSIIAAPSTIWTASSAAAALVVVSASPLGPSVPNAMHLWQVSWTSHGWTVVDRSEAVDIF